MVFQCVVSLDQHGNNAVFNRTLKAARLHHCRLGGAGTAGLRRASEWFVANSPSEELKIENSFCLAAKCLCSSPLCVQLEQPTAILSLVPPPVFAACPCVFPPKSTGSCWGRFAGPTVGNSFSAFIVSLQLVLCSNTGDNTHNSRGGGQVVSNPLKFPF